MPTYDYVCDACEHAFEKFQSMSSPPVKKCPKCGKAKVRRLIGTGAGLIFKGSGFYITDYRDAGYQEKAKADAGESKPAGDAKSGDAGQSKAGETKADTAVASSGDSGSNSRKPASESSTATAAKPAAKPQGKPSAGSKKPSK